VLLARAISALFRCTTLLPGAGLTRSLEDALAARQHCADRKFAASCAVSIFSRVMGLPLLVPTMRALGDPRVDAVLDHGHRERSNSSETLKIGGLHEPRVGFRRACLFPRRCLFTNSNSLLPSAMYFRNAALRRIGSGSTPSQYAFSYDTVH
jgi:hypothetical protein